MVFHSWQKIGHRVKMRILQVISSDRRVNGAHLIKLKVCAYGVITVDNAKLIVKGKGRRRCVLFGETTLNIHVYPYTSLIHISAWYLPWMKEKTSIKIWRFIPSQTSFSSPPKFQINERNIIFSVPLIVSRIDPISIDVDTVQLPINQIRIDTQMISFNPPIISHMKGQLNDE